MPKSFNDSLLKDTLTRVETKLDKLDDKFDAMDKTLALQQKSLEEHIRRTDLLEEKLESDKAGLRAEMPAIVEEQLALRKKNLTQLGIKVVLALLATGSGVAVLKEVLTAVLGIWAG